MDWFNTGFYMDYGYNLVYPQVLPHVKREPEAAQSATVAWGKEKSAHWLQLLNDHWIGPQHDYVCGRQITLADYMGAEFVTLGELIGQKFDNYPNVARWIQTMKSLPSWGKVHEAFDGWVHSMQGQSFTTV
jgi:glutathione S-transferase